MRSHQATSCASNSREKWTRPLVVGPSPVITPSRTTVSARAAVSRQEILDGSRVAAVSANMANGADIGVTLLKSQFLVLVPTSEARELLRRPLTRTSESCACGRKRLVNDSKPAQVKFYKVVGLSR